MKLRNSRGFTLVELMVSIVIIAVLSSLAAVFIKRGIQAADAAKCTSNMRQIHSGVMAVVDNGVRTGFNPPGTFPPYAGQQQDPQNDFVWWDLVAEQMGLAEVVDGDYIWNNHPKETVFQNPLSRHTLGGDRADWMPFHNNPEASGGGFCQNNLVGDWVAPQTDPETIKDKVTRTSEIPYPASTILFGESDDLVADARQPTVAFWGTDNAPQGNYKESAHCMFVDGHVERIENSKLKDREWLDHYRLLVPPEKRLGQPQ
ncbi:MAG: type II secretion system protein [Verrucomicrobiota bacterium]